MTLALLREERESIRDAVLRAVKDARVTNVRGFVARPSKISLAELFEEKTGPSIVGWAIPELFHAMQGVTWGGKGCEHIYRIDAREASSYEDQMVRKCVGGADISAYQVNWSDSYLIFPYIERNNQWIKAFSSPQLGGDDALDFSKTIKGTSERYEMKLLDRLNVRIAKGVVKYPRTAKHLIQFYDQLAEREFEGKRLAQYNKSWYEYHRPRRPALLHKPRILCKRMMKSPAFALDNQGFLPTDSAVALVPKSNFVELKKALSSVIERSLSNEDCLEYVLAFLNSDIFKSLLEKRRAKKRGGYPIVDEKLLGAFVVPRPSSRHARDVKTILAGNASAAILRGICSPVSKTTKLTHY